METLKKGWKKKEILHEFQSKWWFWNWVHRLGNRNSESLQDAMASFTLHDAYRSIAPHAEQMASQIKPRIEYLTPIKCSFLIDTLTTKSHWQTLIRFIDDSVVVAYFLGPACIALVAFSRTWRSYTVSSLYRLWYTIVSDFWGYCPHQTSGKWFFYCGVYRKCSVEHKGFVHLCGCEILDKNWVVTVAHCKYVVVDLRCNRSSSERL